MRAIFGPPDFAAVGAPELANFRQVDPEGVYVYKIGAFAEGTYGQIGSEIFIIFFDRSGKVIFRRAREPLPDEKFADIESDT